MPQSTEKWLLRGPSRAGEGNAIVGRVAAVKFEPTTVAIVVGAVPASAAGLVTPGMKIGEVSLAQTAPTSRKALRAR